MQNDTTKWKVLFGGFAGYTFDAMDLVMLAMAFQPIMNDLGLSRSEAGLLATATLIGVGISSVVMGWYSDNYGRKKAMLWSLVSFSLLTMAIAAANSWLEILILRFLAGLGLGGLWGVIAAYVAETWPHRAARPRSRLRDELLSRRRRARLVLRRQDHPDVGLARVVPHRRHRPFGRRLRLLLRARIRGLESAARRATQGRKQGGGESVCRRDLQGRHGQEHRSGDAGVRLFALSAYWGTTTWLPTYLVKERGLSVADMGMFMTILSVGMFFGYNLFGWLADVIGKRNALCLSLFGSAVMLTIYAMTEDRTTLLWMGPAYAFFMAFVGLMGSYYGELFPTRIRTTGSGFCFNVGRGFSAFAPFILGGIATAYSLQTSILLCAIPFLAAAIATAFMPSTEALAKVQAKHAN